LANGFSLFVRANKGELDKMMNDCSDAIRLDPEDAKAYLCRAQAYWNKNEQDKAIADYTMSIHLNPDSVVYHARGLAYSKKGDKAKAREDFDQAKKLDDNKN
jgi:tetratricopeptide (TPR) repeat protein